MKDKLYDIFSLAGEYALYGMLFFIPISISFIEIFAGIMFAGFVGRKIINPDFKFLLFWPNLPLLLFFLFNMISLSNSGKYIGISLHALTGKWMQYLGIYVFVQDIARDNRIFRNGLVIFLASAALAALSGLTQYFFGIEFLRHKSMTTMSDTAMQAATSSFAHYNSFGVYLVVALSLGGAMLLMVDRFCLKAVSLSVFCVVATTAIMLTFSRGSWLSLTVSYIFMLFFAKKNLKWLIPFTLVIIGMVVFLPIHERLFLVFKSGGDNNRFRYWITAWKMIKDYPFFGIGVGTFMANFPKYFPPPLVKEAYAHNCYLQIWVETGIFSLLSFISFVASLMYFGLKRFLSSRDFLLLGLLSGVVGFLVHSFFDTGLYSLQLAVLFWAWLGLITAKLHIVNNE